MVSNQFVELKGNVFKKFDENNLFQMSSSGNYCHFVITITSMVLDIRERFHYIVLLLIVMIRNLAQFQWDLGELVTVLFLLGTTFHCRSFTDTIAFIGYNTNIRSICRLD